MLYPRHLVIASEPFVKAGEAILCEGLPYLDCFAASRLAMTTPAPSLRAVC
ncbi:MAG: hypothetical protein LBT00_13990 [Spirochaetaceae bacterium]|nr:hypothetical protein [Spirochaetaceae bacterium]